MPLAPHLVFEALAYALGFLVYRRLRWLRGDVVDEERRWSLLVAVVFGAAIGSKLLHQLVDPGAFVAGLGDPLELLGGKTIVGALLGGWLAVELVKPRLGIERATGDLYALPLCVGIAVGRVGCFLTGLEDSTHGRATQLAWGLDFGDGVARHPVRLLEIAFVSGLGVWLLLRPPQREGAVFLTFLFAYFGFRFAIDFLKDTPRFGGLGTLQWASLAGAAGCAFLARRRALAARTALQGLRP